MNAIVAKIVRVRSLLSLGFIAVVSGCMMTFEGEDRDVIYKVDARKTTNVYIKYMDAHQDTVEHALLREEFWIKNMDFRASDILYVEATGNARSDGAWIRVRAYVDGIQVMHTAKLDMVDDEKFALKVDRHIE